MRVVITQDADGWQSEMTMESGAVAKGGVGGGLEPDAPAEAAKAVMTDALVTLVPQHFGFEVDVLWEDAGGGKWLAVIYPRR